MRVIQLTAFFIVLAICVSAQNGSLSGKLKDKITTKKLGLATITVFKAKDTSIITYRLSNPEGEFRIPNLPLDIPLRLIVTFSGYEAYRQEFLLSKLAPELRIDSILMIPTSQQLDEVIVRAEQPPVVIKNDTIEFNASAFKTLPNALVEDLLKKLPGVQVDKEGNISVNGKPVSRMLVDGKTFFGNDPRMATRNLPANLIDKVQVTDDKEELLRNADDNLNNVGKVVNITLKKGVKKGWFGKAYAGAGSMERYEAGAIANIFRDTLQLSLLGYTNNLNKPGFGLSELLQTGGINRSNSNLNTRSISTWSNSSGGSGLAINNINFGGLQRGGGIAASSGLGINLNHVPNTKKTLFAQYFYGNVLVDKKEISDVRQNQGDTVIQNNTFTTAKILTNAHSISAGGKFNPDSLLIIQSNISYVIGLTNEEQQGLVFSKHNKFDSLSKANIILDNQQQTYAYQHNLFITKLSAKKRNRRFNIFHTLDINNQFRNTETVSTTRFLYPTIYDSLLTQLRKDIVPQTNTTLSFNYSDLITKKILLRVSGRYEYRKSSNVVTTLIPKVGQVSYDSLNQVLSSVFNRENNRFFLTSAMEFRQKNWSLTPGIRYLTQQIQDQLNGSSETVIQSQQNILPTVSVQYKRLNLNYSKDILLPSAAQLLPIINNSNPYLISLGNSSLKPASAHNFSMNYFGNDPKRNINAYAFINASLTNNDFVQQITLDNKGIQTTKPVNANGSLSFNFNWDVSRQYKNTLKQQFTWGLNGTYRLNRNKLLYNSADIWQQTFNIYQSMRLNLNINDHFEWNNSAYIDYNFTRYSNTIFKELYAKETGFSTELILRMPKHFIWETTFNYSYNGNVPSGAPAKVINWVAALNYTMLKEEKGVLRFFINDLLGQNAGINMSVNRNLISTRQTNVLSRYYTLSFTYNIRPSGKPKQKVGGEKLFMF